MDTFSQQINNSDEADSSSKPLFTEFETYYVDSSPQLSQRWFDLRRQRLTASNFGVAAGHSAFTTREELAEIVAGRKEKEFSPYSRSVMDHGIQTEPEARQWYERNYQVKVEEVGLAIPKWDFRIGSSLDGIVLGTEGMIEIKCPKKRYQPILTYQLARAQGWVPPANYHQHIWDTHYDQMQGGMAITGKKWCDYVVYCTPENDVFVQRFRFDPAYWNEVLYPKIQEWFEKYYQGGSDRRIDPNGSLD